MFAEPTNVVAEEAAELKTQPATFVAVMPDTPLKRTILNLNPDVAWKSQPMFFGEGLGITRFDQVRYPVFEKLTEEQQKNYWRPHDINLAQDAIDYKRMPEHMRHIFDKNMAYQTVMDSVASRAIIEAFMSWASLPEVEDCLGVWSYFERIHNRAYQWIQQNLHSNPSVFFDTILRDKNLIDRAKSIVAYYDEFIYYSNLVKVFGYKSEENLNGMDKYEHKRLAYRAMISVYALESIRFYVSFCCTFAMAEQGFMTGNGKEVKLIQRDENLHVGISLNILRLWPKEDRDFARIAKEEAPFVYSVFKDVVEQETDWARYLFKDGMILGLTVEGIVKYLEHRANRYLKNIGLDEIFENRKNPFGWMTRWVSSDKEQGVPQETEVDTYKVSALNTNVVITSQEPDF